MNVKKLLSIFIGTSLFLAGCGSGDSDTSTNETAGVGEKTYAGSDFSINYPQDWEVIEPDSYTSNVPRQTVVAFRNNIQNEIFTANLSINIQNLDEDISSDDFTKSTLSKTKKALLSFSELPSTDIKIGDIETKIIEFEGKKSPSEGIIHFKSINIVKNKTAYTLMTAYLPNEDESVVNNIDTMLNSFSLK